MKRNRFIYIILLILFISYYSFGTAASFLEKWDIPAKNILANNGKKLKILLDESLYIDKKYKVFKGRKKRFNLKGLDLVVIKPIYISIVIDDVPLNWKYFKSTFLMMDIPITFSVLPFEKKSKKAIKYLTNCGFDIQIHMPMEPELFPAVSPGRPAIMTQNSRTKNFKIFRKALSKMPDAIGMNNHMGSKITKNKKILKYLFEELKKRGLYYLDSKTTPQSVCKEVADDKNMKFIENDIFLDNVVDIENIENNLNEAINIGKRKGHVVVIGHPHKQTYKGLKKYIPIMKKKGFKFISLYELILKIRSE